MLNSFSDLLQKARFDVPVQLTESQRLLGGNMFTKQAVIPPHELVAALYPFKEIFHPLLTGEPGSIEAYWQQNTDLLEAINDPNLEPWQLLYCFLFLCSMNHFSFACINRGDKRFNPWKHLGQFLHNPPADLRGWGRCPAAFRDFYSVAYIGHIKFNIRYTSAGERAKLWSHNCGLPHSYLRSSCLEFWMPPKLGSQSILLTFVDFWDTNKPNGVNWWAWNI